MLRGVSAESGWLQAWLALANIEAADVVKQVHVNYLRVGADIIISTIYGPVPRACHRLVGTTAGRTWHEPPVRMRGGRTAGISGGATHSGKRIHAIRRSPGGSGRRTEWPSHRRHPADVQQSRGDISRAVATAQRLRWSHRRLREYRLPTQRLRFLGKRPMTSRSWRTERRTFCAPTAITRRAWRRFSGSGKTSALRIIGGCCATGL